VSGPRTASRRRCRTAAWRVDRDRLERELLPLEGAHAQVRLTDRPQHEAGQQHAGREACELARAQAAHECYEHGDSQGGRGDRTEVHGRKPLEREHQTHDERAAQRTTRPEAVEREKGEREEHGDLGVQVRQARPAVRAGRKEGAGHEGRERSCRSRAARELHPEARQQQAAQQGDVVREDGAERTLQRATTTAGSQQGSPENASARERMEGRRVEQARRVL
jgi:hypothetical protein